MRRGDGGVDSLGKMNWSSARGRVCPGQTMGICREVIVSIKIMKLKRIADSSRADSEELYRRVEREARLQNWIETSHDVMEMSVLLP